MTSSVTQITTEDLMPLNSLASRRGQSLAPLQSPLPSFFEMLENLANSHRSAAGDDIITLSKFFLKYMQPVADLHSCGREPCSRSFIHSLSTRQWSSLGEYPGT